MSDVFREVNEDLRREQLKQLWNKYGKFVVAIAVLIVVAVAAYQYLDARQQRQASESGDRFQATVDLYAAGDLVSAEAAFLALAEDGHGDYPTLALMSAAGIRAETGDIAGAAAAFDAVALANNTDPALRDAARIRAALLLVDTEPLAAIRQRMEPFTEEGNPYRILAFEILAVAAIGADELGLAGDWVVEMVQDPTRSAATDERANALFSYLIARLAAEAPEPAPLPGLPADLLGLGPLAPGLVPGLVIDNPPAGGGLGFDPAAPAAPVAPAADAPGDAPAIPLLPGLGPAGPFGIPLLAPAAD